MESILVALITGGLSLLGVFIANGRSSAAVDAKLDKFDFVANKEAANMAFVACWKAISPAAKEFLTAAYEDAETYLKGKIEAEVRAQKGGNALALGEPVWTET